MFFTGLRPPVRHEVERVRLVRHCIDNVGQKLLKDAVSAAPGDRGVELRVQEHPLLQVIRAGHLLENFPKGLHIFVAAALGGKARCRHFDVGPCLHQGTGGIFAELEVRGNPVGDDERALAGMRGGEPECGA